MRPCGDASDLELALELIGRELAQYLAEDRHWREAGSDRPAHRPAVRWPSSMLPLWPHRDSVVDHAWNLGIHEYGRRWSQARADEQRRHRAGQMGGPVRAPLAAGWHRDESSPHCQRVSRVCDAAVAHALRACRKRFGSGRLAGKRQQQSAQRAHAVAEALRGGALSVAQAFEAASVSRAHGYRILAKKSRP